MSAPILNETYPASSDIGIPIGISLTFTFDRGIELESALSSVVLYGEDRDLTSGPDQATWVDRETGNNPLFLTSPGFYGLVPISFALEYVDLGTGLAVDAGTVTAETDETGANYGHRLIVTPLEALAADVTYNVFVVGDPDSIGAGVSARTTFDVEEGGSNVSTTGDMENYGLYTRVVADRVIVEITKAGDIGTAQYQWYYQSAGIGTAITGRVTSRRYRRLEDGLQVKFSGSGFVLGDTYEFNVEPAERMVASTSFVFTTNDGSFSAPPDSPSTPAESQPPASILLPVDSTGSSSSSSSSSEVFEVIDSNPVERAYNVDIRTNTFTVQFSEAPDPSTVTDDTVTIWRLPALGQYSGSFVPEELSKKLTLSGDTLTIEI